MTQNCQNCGSEITPGGSFCGECGFAVQPPQHRSNRKRFAIVGVVLGAVAGLLIAAYLLAGGSLPFSSEEYKSAEKISLEDSDVAVVNESAISIDEFTRSLASYTAMDSGTDGAPSVLDPPDFVECIAEKAKSNDDLSSEELTEKCETDWNTAKVQLMTSLVQKRWYELEAEERGIVISDTDVRSRFEELKEQSFTTEDEFQTFLKDSSQSEDDVVLLVRATMTQEKVDEAVAKGQPPSDEAIERQYENNKAKYASPESRDISLVFNSSRSEAAAARRELDSGASWASVADSYSQDTASKEDGGAFPNVTEGQFPDPLDSEVFAASRGEIVGPIKTQYGYYVFEVTKTTAAKDGSLEQAKDQIRTELQAEQTKKSTEEFQKQFKAKWKATTKCAPVYFVKEVCGA